MAHNVKAPPARPHPALMEVADPVVDDVDGKELNAMTLHDAQRLQLIKNMHQQPFSRYHTFYVGTNLESDIPQSLEKGREVNAHMYVEKLTPNRISPQSDSIVLIHGDYQTGQHTKPDGGLGWVAAFLEMGYEVYVVDLPGVGRSANQDEHLTRGNMVRPTVISKQMTAVDIESNTTRGKRQWPGSGHIINPANGQVDKTFMEFYASLHPLPGDKKERQYMAQHTLASLLNSVEGTSVLIGCGSGATMAWLAADAIPNKVSSVVALEPAGPPFGKPYVYNRQTKKREYSYYMSFDRNVHQYGLADINMNIHPPVSHLFGNEHEDGGFILSEYWGSKGGCLVPTHPHQLIHLQKMSHLILTAPHSHHVYYDWATAAFMQRAGLYVKHSHLADLGIHGNGSLMFLEENSSEVACVVDRWIRRVAAKKLPPIDEYQALKTGSGMMLPPRFGPGFGRGRRIKCEDDPPAMQPSGLSGTPFQPAAPSLGPTVPQGTVAQQAPRVPMTPQMPVTSQAPMNDHILISPSAVLAVPPPTSSPTPLLRQTAALSFQAVPSHQVSQISTHQPTAFGHGNYNGQAFNPRLANQRGIQQVNIDLEYDLWNNRPVAVPNPGQVQQNRVTLPQTPTCTQPAPVTQAPMNQAWNQTSNQASTTQASVGQTRIAQVPVTQAPVTQAPITRAPITRAPVTRAPITRAPVAQSATRGTEPMAPVTLTMSQGSAQPSILARDGLVQDIPGFQAPAPTEDILMSGANKPPDTQANVTPSRGTQNLVTSSIGDNSHMDSVLEPEDDLINFVAAEVYGAPAPFARAPGDNSPLQEAIRRDQSDFQESSPENGRMTVGREMEMDFGTGFNAFNFGGQFQEPGAGNGFQDQPVDYGSQFFNMAMEDIDFDQAPFVDVSVSELD